MCMEVLLCAEEDLFEDRKKCADGGRFGRGGEVGGLFICCAVGNSK